MLDTDLSTTPNADVSEGDILDALEVEEAEIQIRPPRRLDGDGDVLKAFPVEFRFTHPPAPLDRRERHFRVDIAARGLDLEPELLALRHEYPFELGIEGIEIPMIALVEAVAEKTFSFGAFQLAKHYADLAYVVDHFPERLETERRTLRDLTALKLERNIRQFPGLMARRGIRDYASLRPAFVQDAYLRVVKAQWSTTVGYVGQASEHYTFDRAFELVRERLMPLLFV